MAVLGFLLLLAMFKTRTAWDILPALRAVCHGPVPLMQDWGNVGRCEDRHDKNDRVRGHDGIPLWWATDDVKCPHTPAPPESYFTTQSALGIVVFSPRIQHGSHFEACVVFQRRTTPDPFAMSPSEQLLPAEEHVLWPSSRLPTSEERHVKQIATAWQT